MTGLKEDGETAGVSKEKVLFKLDFLEVKVEQLERKVSRKADEVVSVQVLQHRSELESIYETIHGLNSQMNRIDEALSQILKTTDTASLNVNEKNITRRNAASHVILPSI